MTIYRNFEIARTGKLRQYYTLYQEISATGSSYHFSSYSYIKNLSIKEDLAIQSFNQSFPGESYTLVESPQREYANLTAFDLTWKKTPRGFVTDPDSNFWSIWRLEKSLLKEIGFRVFKQDSGQFVLFFKYVDNQGLDEAFSKLAEIRAQHTPTGDFYGTIGKRVQIENAVIEKVYHGVGYYGDFTRLTIKYGIFTFDCRYTGTKLSFKQGETLNFKATVKSHEILDLTNTTVITRISK